MKALPFVIPKTEETFMVQVDQQPYFYDILHRHPEMQLTLIVEGEGTIIAGDSMGAFKPGDIFLLGHNMPHVFRSDRQYYSDPNSLSHAISLFFDERSWLGDFVNLPEAKKLNSFFKNSGRGFKMESTDKHPVREMINSLTKLSGMKKLLRSLNILHELSVFKELQPLTIEVERHILSEDEGQRMNDIFQFSLKEYHRQISIAEVAEIAHLTTNSFCRFFKKRTRKTYVTFLNEIRIRQACLMLPDQDHNISNISQLCGFENLSNFNRVFKLVTGMSPSDYRKSRLF